MNIVQDQDQEQLISQIYPSFYTHVVPQTGVLVETTNKPQRRRRRGSKGERNGGQLKKRKLSEKQVNLLELSFGNEHKLESERKDKLALESGLDPRQVAVWFQNRRARWKTKKLEEEYSQLKNAHDSVVVEKCHLETEVIKLKEKLCEAENKISKFLEEHSDGGSINSSSSLSMEMEMNQQQMFPGEFMVEGWFDNLWGVPDYHAMGWVN